MRRYKKEDLTTELKEDFSEWDFRKIIMVIILLLIIVWGLFYFLGGKNLFSPFSKVLSRSKPSQSASQAQKVKVQPVQDAQKKLDNLKKEITNLNVSDVTKNSPQVKKIQNDLQSLEQLPGNKAKQVCQQICSNL